jgi:hypothetical protein
VAQRCHPARPLLVRNSVTTRSNQISIATTSNTYTMGSITSDSSKAARS